MPSSHSPCGATFVPNRHRHDRTQHGAAPGGPSGARSTTSQDLAGRAALATASFKHFGVRTAKGEAKGDACANADAAYAQGQGRASRCSKTTLGMGLGRSRHPGVYAAAGLSHGLVLGNIPGLGKGALRLVDGVARQGCREDRDDHVTEREAYDAAESLGDESEPALGGPPRAQLSRVPVRSAIRRRAGAAALHDRGATHRGAPYGGVPYGDVLCRSVVLGRRVAVARCMALPAGGRQTQASGCAAALMETSKVAP